MDNKKQSSIVGILSSGYESPTVVQYDPTDQAAKDQAQIGKAVEEKVTTENFWREDQHLPMGLGVMSFKEAAISLRKLARRLAVMEMEYKQAVSEDKQPQAVRVAAFQKENVADTVAAIKRIGDSLEAVSKNAQYNHPALYDPEPWLEESSAQLGDEDWVNIGDAQFDDQRNVIGEPL